MVKPDWGKGYFRKGMALQMQRRTGEAYEAFRVGLQIDPTNQGLKTAFDNASRMNDEASLDAIGVDDSIHQACKAGDMQQVQELLQGGADLNSRDQDTYTPLHYAAWEGHIDVVRLLTDGDADVNATTKAGQTPLHLASWWGRYSSCKRSCPWVHFHNMLPMHADKASQNGF